MSRSLTEADPFEHAFQEDLLRVHAVLAEFLAGVCRYKTGKYTMERPLHLGAVRSGAGDDVLAACTAYALPLGEAYQLRDDLLGLFSAAAVAGKSPLDDLREGKYTVPLILALDNATKYQRSRLQAHIGNPAVDETGAEEVRDIVTSTGARAEVENMITHRRDEALDMLDTAGFPDSATAALRHFAEIATSRTS